jgi:hypothetical protein
MIMENRTCTKCKKSFPATTEFFFKSIKGKLQAECKECKTEYTKKWREKNRVRSRRYMNSYMRRHRTTLTDMDFKELFDFQDGKCAICGIDNIDDKPKSWKRNLCVDHDHETGKIRGLLCHRCNLGLGYFVDNPDILRKAANYLERD